MNGIIIIDKPADWTSQDVVSKLRGLYHERRIGHGGTLDPMATGVLPVFLGRATRGVEFFESAEKEYIADLRLGITTDTQDTTGTVRSEKPVSITKEELEAVLSRFTGEIDQIPPMYSALKVNGRKLYELARAGQEIERKPRRITIHELELLEGDGESWKLRVRCSKGTYVRTLCHDIGQALGCGGCMAGLRRTFAGIYGIGQAVPLHELMEMSEEERIGKLLPLDSMFSQYPQTTVSPKQERSIRNGGSFTVHGIGDGTYRVYAPDGSFLSLSRVENGTMKTIKSFFEVSEK